MRPNVNMKRASRLAVLVVLLLWVGYATGYRRGMHDDQREWWASVRFDSQGNRVFDGPRAKSGFDPYYVRQNTIPDKLDR